MPPWVFPIFTIFSHRFLKEKEKKILRTYTLLIQYLKTDKILFSNSSDSSKICPLYFFFYPLFQKHLIP